MHEPRSMWARIGRSLLDPRRAIRFARDKLSLMKIRRVRVDGVYYREYRGKRFPDDLWNGSMMRHIEPMALDHCKGRGIDVGADRWPLHGAVAIQEAEHQNAYCLDAFEDGSLDFVFSSHCLEHLERWQEALELWIRKLRTDGTILLYLPHESMTLWNPGSPLVADGHKWQPRHEVLVPFLEEHGVKVIDYNTGRDEAWSFHILGKKVAEVAAPEHSTTHS